MGINTWAAFVGSDQQAVVDGDFVMLENELQSVLKALRGAGINVVAIHNHIETENPRIVFLHYWGVGPTTDLAKGLKSALDTQKKRKVSTIFFCMDLLYFLTLERAFPRIRRTHHGLFEGDEFPWRR